VVGELEVNEFPSQSTATHSALVGQLMPEIVLPLGSLVEGAATSVLDHAFRAEVGVEVERM
jgi:hypothetical protein